VPVSNAVPESVIIVGRRPDALPQVVAQLQARGLRVVGPYGEDDLARIDGLADCAILDLSGGDGTLRRALGALSRSLAPMVLVITALEDTRTRIEALRLGVADHVVAPFDVTEIIARVEVLLARRRRLRRDRIEIGDVAVQLTDRRVTRNGADVLLTPREFDVLVVLMNAHGRAVSKPELLRHVWHDEERNVNAVEAHVSALRRKLEQSGTQVIHTVHRSGYAFRAVRTSSPLTREALILERKRLLRERDEAVARRNEILTHLRKNMDRLEG
jgi:two-component system, OmpR family, response regulator